MAQLLASRPEHAVALAVQKAWMQLLVERPDLFNRHVNEVTISSHLCRHLANELQDYHVDAEYNRLGHGEKRIQVRGVDTKVRPDGIVHRSGEKTDNLLVIEVKIVGRGGAKERRHAHDKLRAFVDDDRYAYRYALYLEFGQAPGIVNEVWYMHADK